MASANGAPPPGANLSHIASTPKAVLGCIAFAVFWLMAVFPSVKFLPIGRTAGAVMSAALMVAFKVLTPSEAFAAVNLPTVALLFGTMIVSTFLERAGAFEYLGWMLAWKSLGGADLLCRLCFFSALSSALLTNDTTCVILTSFILGLCRARGLPPQPYLIALATSANIGSALTPIGNPQNLIISINGRVSFGKFLAGLIGPVAVTIAVNMLGLLVIYGRRLTKKRLRKRLEEGADREEGLRAGLEENAIAEGKSKERLEDGGLRDGEIGEATGNESQGREIVEELGLETDSREAVPKGKASQEGETESADRQTEGKVERSTGATDSSQVQMQHPSLPLIRKGSLQTPQRSLSLNSRRRLGRINVEDDSSLTNQDGESASKLQTDGIEVGSLESEPRGIVITIDQDERVGNRTVGKDSPEAVSNGLEQTSSVPVTNGLSKNPDVRTEGVVLDEGIRNRLEARDFDDGMNGESHKGVVFNKASSTQSESDSPSRQTNLSNNQGETTQRRGHQIQVVIPPPGLEHREGPSAVAPTWRGRLRRLRKKRPPWVFKASVYIIVLGMLAALLAGLDLPWVAMGAAVILICLDFRDAEETLDQVSYSLLVFFSGMFIAVEGFNRTGIPGQIWSWLEPHARLNTATGTILLAVVVTLLSNVASNVPTVLLLGPRLAASAASTAGISETYAWLFLAFTSTVAGNLTMVGSAANLIVSEEAFRAKDGMKYKLSFWNHLRYGLPSTIVVLAVGIPLISA